MQKIYDNSNHFWLKIVIACVVLAIIFNFFGMAVGFLFSTLIGGFVDLVLFIVLDVFVAAILIAVDILLWAVDVFVSLLVGGLAIAGSAALIAVIVIPVALYLRHSQSKNNAGDAEYK